ncbi:MAG: hypothetical protein ACRDQH_14790 [Pseudonocardiaceae bacterium]
MTAIAEQPERPGHQQVICETAASITGMKAALAADPDNALGR